MKELRPVQVILLGFLITIFAGSILLTLPIATQSGQATPYIDALFTATTSVCVTGLIVETTMTHWSIFGQAVIILLVQIGGLGVITITTGMFFMLRKRITLGNRMLIQESRSILSRPVSLSSSYFTLQPLGISITAIKSSGEIRLGSMSCQIFIVISCLPPLVLWDRNKYVAYKFLS